MLSRNSVFDITEVENRQSRRQLKNSVTKENLLSSCLISTSRGKICITFVHYNVTVPMWKGIKILRASSY